MSDLRAMSDEDLKALKKTGNKAARILKKRRRERDAAQLAYERAQKERGALMEDHLVSLARDITKREDKNGRTLVLYRNVPVPELLAACPIPPDMMATLTNATAMLAAWDAYVDAKEHAA